MHSRIFQVSAQPIPEDEWLVAEDITDFDSASRWFLGTIAEYVTGMSEEQEREAVKYLSTLPGLQYAPTDNSLTIVRKKDFFEPLYAEFTSAIKDIEEMDLDGFSGTTRKDAADGQMRMWAVKNAYKPKTGVYVYDYDSTLLRPLAEWLRWNDDGDKFYIGAVLDYKY